MKNLYKLLIGVLALSTVTSCDDYLEVDHYDILPADFMFKTEENVLSGLNGPSVTCMPGIHIGPKNLYLR